MNPKSKKQQEQELLDLIQEALGGDGTTTTTRSTTFPPYPLVLSGHTWIPNWDDHHHRYDIKETLQQAEQHQDALILESTASSSSHHPYSVVVDALETWVKEQQQHQNDDVLRMNLSTALQEVELQVLCNLIPSMQSIVLLEAQAQQEQHDEDDDYACLHHRLIFILATTLRQMVKSSRSNDNNKNKPLIWIIHHVDEMSTTNQELLIPLLELLLLLVSDVDPLECTLCLTTRGNALPPEWSPFHLRRIEVPPAPESSAPLPRLSWTAAAAPQLQAAWHLLCLLMNHGGNGSTIRPTTLLSILNTVLPKQEQQMSWTTKTMVHFFQGLQQAGILKTFGSTTATTTPRIVETATTTTKSMAAAAQVEYQWNMVPDMVVDNKNDMAFSHHQVGMAMIQHDFLFFRAMSLLDPPKTPVHLWATAAQRAIHVGCVAVAHSYVLQGVHTLSQMPFGWREKYDLSLQIYRMATKTSFAMGDLQKGRQLAETLLDRAILTEDKFPSLHSLSRAFVQYGQTDQAVETAKQGLALLDLKSSLTSSGRAAKDAKYVKKYLSKATDYDILVLPLLKDTSTLFGMEFLSIVAEYSADAQESKRATMLQLKLSFHQGLSGHTAVALTHLAMDSCSMRWTALARKILGLTKAYALEAAVFIQIASFVDAWKGDHGIADLYQQAYRSGMKTGNTAVAFDAASLALWHKRYCGHKLSIIQEEAKNLLKKASIYKALSSQEKLKEQMLPLEYLVGGSDMKSSPSGRLLVDWEALQGLHQQECRGSVAIYRSISLLELAVTYRNFSFGAQVADAMAASLSSMSPDGYSYNGTCRRLFYSILCYLELSRKNMRYRQKSRKAIHEFEKLLDQKTSKQKRQENHLLLILYAHQKAVAPGADGHISKNKKRAGRIHDAYIAAMSACAKNKAVHDSALVNEMAGEYFYSIGEELVFPRRFFTQAYCYYSEWGAFAKAKELSERHSTYVDASALARPFDFVMTEDDDDQSPSTKHSGSKEERHPSSTDGMDDSVVALEDEDNGNKQENDGADDPNIGIPLIGISNKATEEVSMLTEPSLGRAYLMNTRF